MFPLKTKLQCLDLPFISPFLRKRTLGSFRSTKNIVNSGANQKIELKRSWPFQIKRELLSTKAKKEFRSNPLLQMRMWTLIIWTKYGKRLWGIIIKLCSRICNALESSHPSFRNYSELRKDWEKWREVFPFCQ